MNKIIVIQASRKDSIGINQFSKAEMLKFQRDYTNAINIFKEIKERKRHYEQHCYYVHKWENNFPRKNDSGF